MNKLSDEQAQLLIRISIWWKDELLKQGKLPESDKRLDWLMSILTKKKYSDNAKQFLNQMRDLYMGKKPQSNSQYTTRLKANSQFRSTTNSRAGFPMI